jgi:hypothetical protein
MIEIEKMKIEELIMKNGLMSRGCFLLTQNWENQNNILSRMMEEEDIHNIEEIKIREYWTLTGNTYSIFGFFNSSSIK